MFGATHWRELLALFALYIIWGSTYYTISIAIESFPPFLMSGARFMIAGGLLFGFLRWRGMPVPSLKQWGGAALVGSLLLGGGNGGVAFAEQHHVASGLAAVWIASMPIIAALFAGLFGRWPSRIEWVGLMIGFAGVGILNMENNLRANPIGVIALTTATTCWALGSVWSRHLPLPNGAMASAAQMLSGGVLLLLMGFGTGEAIAGAPSTRSILAVAYLVVFGSLVAFSSYAYLLRNVRPTIATSYAYVNPVVALALGAWFGNEPITVVGVVAMLVILSGVGMVMAGKK